MEIYNRLLQQYGKEANAGLDRFARRIQALAEIGMTSDLGSSRIAYSQEDRQAKELLKAWMKEAGLEVREDPVGNVIGTLLGANPEIPSVMSGSHIDTVPNGGHFDGVVGVLSALEVAQRWSEQGFVPQRSLEVVAFSDEEGSRFHASLTGSHFMTGQLNLDSVKHYQDDEGRSFEQVLQEHGLDATKAEESVRKPEDIYAFIEMHIEQGQVLEKQEIPIGIVNGIAGPAWIDMKWGGRAAHAGATPMGLLRSDALVAASECVMAIEKLPSLHSRTAVATVGKLNVYPNGSNVIPSEVSMVVDVRDIHLDRRDQLLDAIIQEAESIALRRGVQFQSEVNIKVDPTSMDPALMDVVQGAIEKADLPVFNLTSGAGHDAMVIGRQIPTAMIFIRCLEGISHNPLEWASLEDLELGILVLDDTLRQLVHTKA
ncbi:Zn-dependent hydrolase [Cohnella abietis]|uniref:Zn-dependent hydrolase n=1 Tax=Cohnella abietis TaxID=2507935 RepID=A0A3T1D5B7_9BACL|nr:Zn-dependent hydrolase [Cohnella abietis]BBI33302.1 Zn-dependent hydrolase [Cohnella abietis]